MAGEEYRFSLSVIFQISFKFAAAYKNIHLDSGIPNSLAFLAEVTTKAEDWLTSWKKYWAPELVGNHFLILPCWMNLNEKFRDKKIIKIDPFSGFSGSALKNRYFFRLFWILEIALRQPWRPGHNLTCSNTIIREAIHFCINDTDVDQGSRSA